MTTWNYQAGTGALTSKVDALNRSESWTRDTGGRIATRTDSRSVVTTYAYHSVTRDLQTRSYSGGATTTVSTGFDRLGRLQSVVQGADSWTYAYDPTHLFLDTETIRYDTSGDGVWTNGTVDFERVLDRSRDAQLRNNGWQLKAGAAAEHASSFGYEGVAGRMNTVTSSAGTFSYGYHPAAPHLITTITGAGANITNSWEPNRDLLDYKENKFGATVVSKFDYTSNNMARRTQVDSVEIFRGSFPRIVV